MCDGFLMLAHAKGGLSCFLVPRFLPDGTVNPLRLQRLKEKLGNRSNASSEVELEGANGWLIGEEGRSEEHTAELQSPMSITYADFYLKQKNKTDVTIKAQSTY